jgi:hypothetical protein
MARKDLPWQAEFTEQDRRLILEWINRNLSPWDRWIRPLAELAKDKRELIIHLTGLDTPPIRCNVGPQLDAGKQSGCCGNLGSEKISPTRTSANCA